ncbi:LysR family transcriptional regulator [Leisingera sp. JC1]|uniref:LysR family transcriptional regulator n=1 Tax=Leisingera sp. JC1 TaxID=1855282 RepID=UPI0008031EA0|nr:LysR family transcriptional regulator [Leisingera sp. JC1]OBY25188.1 LysR family transcriptional regulator [Leisingera sp. JC1]
MDIILLRTFVEVASTGSFAAAAKRLFVTQSAVSLRIQRLEEELGQPMFTRSKAGAELTPAGTEFERFAFGHIKLWEESKQQVAIPEGFTKSLIVGAEHSLWPRMGFRWLDAIREELPFLSIRAEVGTPERLTRYMIEGVVQTILVYTPQLRPGFQMEKVMEDELVMVASWPEPQLEDAKGRYLFVDWGPEFVHAHGVHLPQLSNPGLTFALGALSLDFLLNRKMAAYVPARAADQWIEAERLHLVPDAPRFPYPIYHVWRDDLDGESIAVARNTLNRIAQGLEVRQALVIDHLADISEEDEVGILSGSALPADDTSYPK